MHCRHLTLAQTPVKTARFWSPTIRVGVLCTVSLASALFAGCGELEPMREPEVVDLELTTDTLKASMRDAQRTVAELRADLEARRRELAEAQVARAQLEGRVREAERRVLEARQVIELQREELAAARAERTNMSRSSLQYQSQMRLLQKQLSKVRKSSPAANGQEAAPVPTSDTIRKSQNAMQVSATRNRHSEFLETVQVAPPSVAMTPLQANSHLPSELEESTASTRYVFVKPGDTLWSIAQKYRVQLEQLRNLNNLTDNRIVSGQALWLPENRSMPRVGPDTSASTP